jgi:predicted dithiol-disulfide oxidoreductase (DUF899 family)
MMQQRISTRDEWLAARKALLIKEKALTRAQDELAAERRRLPMVKVDKTYVFDTPAGRRTLADLFEGRSQLVVYHFMLAPDWAEGCASCSLLADHLDSSVPHLEHRDVTLAVVARAPLATIEAFKRRMGWTFAWVSSYGSDFNYDYHVSFTSDQIAAGTAEYNFQNAGFPIEEGPGISVFFKDPSGTVYHTYSTYARGGEAFIGVYRILDFVPKGRDEGGLAFSMAWVRHHDKYGPDYTLDPNQLYEVPATIDSCCAGH